MIEVSVFLTRKVLRNEDTLADVIANALIAIPGAVRSAEYEKAYKEGYENGVEAGVIEGKMFKNANDLGVAHAKRGPRRRTGSS